MPAPENSLLPSTDAAARHAMRLAQATAWKSSRSCPVVSDHSSYLIRRMERGKAKSAEEGPRARRYVGKLKPVAASCAASAGDSDSSTGA